MIGKIKRWIDYKRRGIKVWGDAYVYPSAKIGDGVSIGRGAEIGHNVSIGQNTRIGAGAFIPEGVVIGKDCFVGPKSTFSNDMYPMSPKDQWQKTVVCDGASIGAGACIRPGVVIGIGALVGMGSVVTKHIPSYEIWAGVPARKIRERREGE